MATVKNRRQLIAKGSSEHLRKARALILDSYETALDSVDPAGLIKTKIKLEKNILSIDSLRYDLQRFKKIYVVGGGKAGGAMAAALEKVMANWITSGIVNVPKGKIPKTEKITLNQASHPLPDQAGVEGAKQMLQIAEEANEDDLVICLISGGGSSLMPSPRDGITLKDKQELTGILLKSGAAIHEVNIVRKHLSSFKGGLLAKKVYPATVLNLIISDVVGDALGDIASGPTAPDFSTFSDAICVLKKYSIWDNAPLSVRSVLVRGEMGILPETPKPNEVFFEKVQSSIIGNNRLACLAASRFFKSKGINAQLLATPLEGEARQVGAALALRTHEAVISRDSTEKSVCFIVGGETTVTVKGEGIGGRNQELTLATAMLLRGLEGFVFASLSTDGLDGSTNAAGALCDSDTLALAEFLKLNPEQYLAEHDSNTFFCQLKDLAFTGQTGTNVNDIAIMLIL